MKTLTHVSTEVPNESVSSAAGLEEAHQTAQDAAEKEELVSARLADLRSEMRPPGKRQGELTPIEAIGHDLIAGAMQRHKGITHLERRIRQKYAAERLSAHIRKLRGEDE